MCLVFSESLGAWEFTGRLDRMEVDPNVFAVNFVGKTPVTLATPLVSSRGATEFTVGFNWYWNRFVRMQFNYEHSMFDEPIRLGGSPTQRPTSHDDALITRLQLLF